MPDERPSRDRARDELQAGQPAAFFGTVAQLLAVAGEAGLVPGELQVHGTVIPLKPIGIHSPGSSTGTLAESSTGA